MALRLSRRSRYLALGIAALAAGTVVFNLGHGTTRSDRVSDLKGLVSQLQADVAACNSSARDSFSVYLDVIDGHPGDRGRAEGVVGGDQPYCTPVGNTDLFDLATLEAPPSLRSLDLQPTVQALAQWAYPQAAGAISDVDTLLKDPADPVATADLHSRLAAMRSLEASVNDSLARAGASLGVSGLHVDLGATDGLGSG